MVGKPLLAMTAAIRLAMDLARVSQASEEVSNVQTSNILFLRSAKEEGSFSATFFFICSRRFSIGLRSGEFPGQGRTGMFSLVRNALVDLLAWQGDESCRNQLNLLTLKMGIRLSCSTSR